MNKKIALFLDGTWNEPGDNTNVWRLKLMLARQTQGGVNQISYYDTGVGTKWYDRVSGGALGIGLSKNIREAYQWLMEHYSTDDEVYIFGFSRGAYTARSLAGMIARCGLLKPGAPLTVLQVFNRYKQDTDAQPLYTLQYEQRGGKTDFDLEERWLLEYSERIPIKMIGVWDTVGALGIPGNLPFIGRKQFYFLNTRLSNIYEHAYHALALDENRKPYRPTLWTKYLAKIDGSDEIEEQNPKRYQNIEQRWFIGAHSNVGGGYQNDPLAQIPLAWIQQRAEGAGLEFRSKIVLQGDEYRAAITDSYSKFLKGGYKLIRFGRRFFRELGFVRSEKARGYVDTVNETIDESVLKRYQEDMNYRPDSLLTWASRHDQNLNQLSGTVVADYARLNGLDP